MALFRMRLPAKIRRLKIEVKQQLCHHDKGEKRMEWTGLYIDCSKCRKTLGCALPAIFSNMTDEQNEENKKRCQTWYAEHLKK